jgi:hypothetical protein
MKTRTLQFAVVLAAVLASAIHVAAQTTTKETLLRANIPFAFVAGGVHLSAGEYRVYHPGNPYVIVIEKQDGSEHAMTYVRPSSIDPGKNSTKLLFHRYGDQYFLAEVWTEQNREVHQCFQCAMEKLLTAQSRKPATVVVAAMH